MQSVIIITYYKILVDYRDYKKMKEEDCSQVVTHYGRTKISGPCDVAIGPNGEVIIVNHAHNCVVVLDNKLNLLKVIGQGSGNSRLTYPCGVAVTDDVIAVSEWGRHQVKKYSMRGELLSVIGRHGKGYGHFNHPRGLAFNKNKLLYVVDGLNYRVQVFHKDDTFLFSFGHIGSITRQFQFPIKIKVDPNNNVLVTDYDANAINIFTEIGQFIQTVNCNHPWGIVISPAGYLITDHDGDSNIIKVWSPTYQLINQFGKRGSKQGEFDNVQGLAMDSNGTIYVAEQGNNRLQVISNNKLIL